MQPIDKHEQWNAVAKEPLFKEMTARVIDTADVQNRRLSEACATVRVRTQLSTQRVGKTRGRRRSIPFCGVAGTERDGVRVRVENLPRYRASEGRYFGGRVTFCAPADTMYLNSK